MLANELRAFLALKIEEELKRQREHLESGRDREPYSYGHRVATINAYKQVHAWMREFFQTIT